VCVGLVVSELVEPSVHWQAEVLYIRRYGQLRNGDRFECINGGARRGQLRWGQVAASGRRPAVL